MFIVKKLMRKTRNLKEKNNKLLKQENKGITLISLVVTIVVLLILAGISISTLTGENGIIKRTIEAKKETNTSQIKEEVELAWLGIQSKGRSRKWNTSKKASELEKELDKISEADVEAIDGGNNLRVLFKGNEIIINAKDGSVKDFIDTAEIVEPENYVMKWNVGYIENSSETSSRAVAYLVPDGDDYILDIRGSGKVTYGSYWTVLNTKGKWTDYQNAEILELKNKIKKAIIGNDITEIISGCFYECYNISELEYGEKLYVTDRYCLSDTQWFKNEQDKSTHLVIVNSTLLDGQKATGTVVIPDSIKTIANACFLYANITSVQGGNNVETISYTAFSNCKQLTSFNFAPKLKKIRMNAFDHCQSLTNINLPEGLEVIEASAFLDCTSLNQKIILPSTLKVIGGDYRYPSFVFVNCSCTEYEVASGNQYYKTIDGVLYTIDGKTLVSIPRNKQFTDNTYIMPDTVTNLGEASFNRNNTNLNTVVISDNLIINDDLTEEEKKHYYTNVGTNSLTLAQFGYSMLNHYETKNTNTHYISGNKQIAITNDYGDRESGSFLLTADGSELVAIPPTCRGTYQMLPRTVTKIRKNAFYIYYHGTVGQFSAYNISTWEPYKQIHFRIHANTTDINAEQLQYINFLASDENSNTKITLEIEGTNPKYEIVNNQYVEKSN